MYRYVIGNTELPDGKNLAKVQVQVVNLSNENGSHCFVEGGAIHVDGGTHGKDETCHSFVHVVVFFETSESDGKGSRAGAKTQKKKAMNDTMTLNRLNTQMYLFGKYVFYLFLHCVHQKKRSTIQVSDISKEFYTYPK